VHDAGRYRGNAAECLLAAQESQSYYRKLNLALVDTWLSLARQDEAMGNLLATWNTAEMVKPTASAWFPIHKSSSQGTGYRPTLGREGRPA
jgi:hypothetical protein